MKNKLVLCVIIILTTNIGISQTATPPLGDGTSISPYQIATWQNLYWISQNPSVWDQGLYYIQTADIDFSTATPAITTWDPDWLNIPQGWTPIGNDNGEVWFVGSYNGNGHTISGLYINRENPCGLFGESGLGSVIENLGVIGADVSGRDGNVGAFIGWNRGTITNCYSTGSVSGDYGYVGGFSGYSSAGSISHCYSTCNITGSVSGDYDYVGGFSGKNDGTISNCYSTGSVEGVNSVGGFIGMNEGDVSNCYSMGSVTGSDEVGGLIGNKYDGNVSNCFCTGSVTADYSAGGLVGGSAYGSVEDCFWDIETSGQEESDEGTGKTTAEMKDVATFTDYTDGTNGLSTPVWDFEINPNDDGANDNYWDIDPEGVINNGYPFLSWQNGAEVALPVELTSFTANTSGSCVELNWQSVTEVNNYGFEVQKSEIRDQKSEVGRTNHEPRTANQTWTRTGFVEGNGTTNAPKEYSFTDKNLSAGTYSYRLKQIDRDGKFSYSQQVEVEIGSMPKVFALEQNYPNPFNPTTTIGFTIQVSGSTTLKIYDAIGREVASLVNENLEAGVYHQKQFNASHLASGVYFARLTSGSATHVQRLMLMK